MRAFYETRSEAFYVGGMTHYPYPLHVHEIVEMVYLLRGECDMEIDGQLYTLRAGDAAIAFPFAPHSYNRISDDAEGLAAFFSASAIPELDSTFHTLLPDEPVVRGEKIGQDALLAVERLKNAGENSPTRMAWLHLLLVYLMNVIPLHSAQGYQERDLGARVVRYVYEHACENISLSSTARALGISESHLSHLFAQQFHVYFRHFINAIRIDKAVVLMQDANMTLTQICYQSGFDNVRTFRRAFSRQMGMLPTDYIRTLCNEKKRAAAALG